MMRCLYLCHQYIEMYKCYDIYNTECINVIIFITQVGCQGEF